MLLFIANKQYVSEVQHHGQSLALEVPVMFSFVLDNRRMTEKPVVSKAKLHNKIT